MVADTCDVIKNVSVGYVCRSEWPLLGRDRLVGFVDVILSPTLISYNVFMGQIMIVDCCRIFVSAFAGCLFIYGMLNGIFSGSDGQASSFGAINNEYERM
jgi:hypothetical protein